MVLGKLVSYSKRRQLEHFPHTIYGNKLKMGSNLNLRSETMKLREENVDRTFFDVNHIFLDLSPNAKEIRPKINEWDLIKHKSFPTAKAIINKMKRQPIEWGKYLQRIRGYKWPHKGLISKMYKQLIQLNAKKKHPNLKMDRSSEQTFFQRRHTHTGGQQAYAKMLSVISYKVNSKENHTC